ncbi:Fanconi anemia group G protein isoform X2 [Varanus komodoensis]|uniref:Fanconi anemia group G protein isoform X2 n=1 Tax=Varanus komodoensis TaxID=61221 RepID=UPI001CF76997|nr:Fanconi anemia group G protein isoform X2 [Varanus komodoensis]
MPSQRLTEAPRSRDEPGRCLGAMACVPPPPRPPPLTRRESVWLEGLLLDTAPRRDLSSPLALASVLAGLPATFPALPVELAALCNSLLLDLHLSSHSAEELLPKIDHGLSRVLEACAVPAQGCGPEDLWRKLLRQGLPEELQAPLHQLAALQGALWLATGRRGSAAGLFQLLSGAKSQGPSPRHGREAELTSLLQAWCPPDVEASDPLLVENGQHLGGALRVSAALLQGVDELDAGRPAAALAHLQVAATGLCSRQALARIFALMGCCSWKAGKPQMALQHLRRALQVDFAFLPALHQAAALYRQLGLVDAELEALALLHQATVDAAHPGFPSPTELLICGPRLAAFFVQKSPVEVKYTMAQRCLQAGRAAEAVEHYLDLLALLQDGPPAQVSPRRESALPRVPEVFLEAASGLQELARHRDAIAVCEEVVARASELVPERLQVELGCSARAMAGSLRAQAAGVPARQTRESLCCVLWRAAAYLAQGWAWAGLGDPKEAVGLLSRCLNDLLRICFVSTGSSPEEEMERTAIPEAKVLSQIRQLALTGRGAQFLQLERDKEALMDFQHSLCICPDGPTANLYLIHTLWKLGRRQEAAARWQRFCSSPSAPEVPKAESFPLYLLTYVKQMTFPHAESLTRTMESCLRGSGEGT